MGPCFPLQKSVLTIVLVTYILYCASKADAVATVRVAMTHTEGMSIFWYNSSDTINKNVIIRSPVISKATFEFDFCQIIHCPTAYEQCDLYKGTAFICVVDKYFGSTCNSWSSVGWNTGTPWGYKPESALDRKDRFGKSLLERMVLTQPGPCGKRYNGGNMPLVLTIQNPGPDDQGEYRLGMYGNDRDYYTHNFGKFHLRDMELGGYEEIAKPSENPLVYHKKKIAATADPTLVDTLTTNTGFSDKNLWLEWVKYTAKQHNMSNCYVCAGARPHLGTVPLTLPENIQECFLSLYTNKTTDQTLCEKWKQEYPIITKTSKPGEGIAIYKGNYTCYVSRTGNGKFLGNFTEGYCSEYSKTQASKLQNQINSLADVFWICGDQRIRTRLGGNWTGECALAKVLMPFQIIPDYDEPQGNPTHTRGKRSDDTPGGSFDPHVYIDAIGVPRGVPDEFKARDEVAAGFESIIPMITISKGVAWTNYLYYNQQRFVNYTRDAFKGLAEQLAPTSTMAFQNRMALDMVLAEKGGVCKMIKETCCTYIPDNTGPAGKVTIAIKKLEALSVELKKNSGVDNPWSQYFFHG